MTVACQECRSVFRVDPAKVPATGVRARCSVCGGVITIGGGTLPIAVTPSSSRVVSSAFSSAAVPRAAAAIAPAASSAPSAGSATPMPTPIVSTVAPTVMTPPAPAGLSSIASRFPNPAPSPTVTPVVASGSGSVDAERAPVSTRSAATPEGGKRSINPFLNADPGQRARRLARALVSDLVAYHPQKREDGLRDGTLRQLFREEIKKSYEEFVEQVGRELAESSPHFQEALNEILGGGRKLF